MARLPTVLNTDDLPLAELCAARLDGDLVSRHGAFVPVDEPDVPALRARLLTLDVDRSHILERRSAAWVYGAVELPPRMPQLCTPASTRTTQQIGVKRVREVLIGADEIVELGGVRCTTAVRTAFDLLRDPSECDDAVEEIVRRLAAARPGMGELIRDHLDARSHLPFKRLATERLRRAGLGQPSATR